MPEKIGFPSVSTNNPGLMRQYVQMFGNAAGQRRQRSEKKPIPDEQKDDKYFERRRRNNSAAKRSRDLRKRREDEIAIRASTLQKTNAILQTQLNHIKQRQAQLRFLLCTERVADPKY
ncbi:transcription factor ces-2-like [Littorina saxatilis]|uniref:transcription factor ces-2-like n=1 Tax=Littorina saxatilis TaxID=31220 RepID=UPI0038B4800F